MSNFNHHLHLQWLNAKVKRLEARLALIKEKASRLSANRLWTFIAGAVVSTFCFQFLGTGSMLISLTLFVGVFAFLVKEHAKVDRFTHLFEFFIERRKKQIARLTMDWETIPKTSPIETTVDHPFENDLVVTGNRSLHQYLNDTLSLKGEKALASYLLRQNPDHSDIPTKQKIVQELSQLSYFRERLAWKSHEALKFDNSPLDPESLLKWIELRNQFQTKLQPKLILSSAVALINVGLLVINILGILAPWWLVGLIVQYILQTIFSKEIAHLLGDAEKVNENLSAFGSILSFIERASIGKALQLEHFLRPIRANQTKPTLFLNEVKILAGRAALTQGNALVGFLVNLIFPWDLYHSHRLNRLSDRLAKVLPKWIECFTELEIYLSLAEFAHLQSNYSYPRFELSQKEPFIAKDLGHPLLAENQKVTNHFRIHSAEETVLLTGSNMSGKSTFLRTLGVNVILAYTGAPVNASSFTLKPMRLFTCINVSDSLSDGFSYFYAEVRRLRQLLQATKESDRTPVLYLIDEIFRGTNNRERLIGSRSFVKALSQSAGFGVVSTHDLELVKLQDEVDELKNYHFRETIEEGKMKFEYRIHEGPSPTTNALKIMQMEGLPVEQLEEQKG